ncbi:Rap1a/Tai family immunity protein [Cereibacter changlensis]|uniref:Rap1a/Tai family immunity protein n=1 Tax=Cereibacter changlensis TaxID=402884 RepID=UPI00403488FE
MKYFAIAAASWAFAASDAAGQEGANLTGNQLLEICQSEDLAKQGFCIGYNVGVVEGMRWGSAVPLLRAEVPRQEVEATVNSMLSFCLPEGATYGQYQDVIVRYIDRHPETRHTSARLLAQLALIEAFPCTAQ